jgi:hypothetical protein
MLFENRVLRRDEVTGEWRKLHHEEFNELYSSPNIIRVNKFRRMEMGGACSTWGGEEILIEGFGGEA